MSKINVKLEKGEKILAQRETDSEVIVVTSFGRKIRISKEAPEAVQESAEEIETLYEGKYENKETESKLKSRSKKKQGSKKE